MWILVVVLIVALMIPITAILLDSPLGRSIARRLETRDGTDSAVGQLERRVEVLETDLEELTRSLSGMRDELQFVQRLLDDPAKKRRSS